MSMLCRFVLSCFALTSGLSVATANAQLDLNNSSAIQPGALVSVSLIDGRLATGTVDDRTDNHFLWLRSETPRVTLQSGFPWSDIVEISQGSPAGILRLESIDGGENPIASVMPTPLDGPRFFAAPPPLIELPGQELPNQFPDAPIGAVRTIRFHAVVTNWDEDSEDDGVLVRVQPFDSNWQIVPVAGSVSIELLAELDPLTSSAGRTDRRRVHVLERWTVRVDQSDFHDLGADLKLSFRQFRPARDLEFAPIGRLTGRLALPGQGAFEDTCDILLRPPMPFAFDERSSFFVDHLPSEPYRRTVNQLCIE